jgi:hypothetical protein
MTVAQITAKVNLSLKKKFMQKAQHYDLPASGVLSLLMRMFVEGDVVPSFKMNRDDIRTDELEATLQEARAEYARGEYTTLEAIAKQR